MGPMRQPRLFAISAVALLFFYSCSANAEDACPPHPVGVSVSQADASETLYASAFVRPFRNDNETIIEAQQEARIAARLLLQRDKRVPLGANGRLVGAKDEGACSAEGRVFYTVSINPKTAAQATQLNERMRKSLAAKPVPQIPNYSWTETKPDSPEMKEINRLFNR
jgi:hypothetical protein